VHAFDVLGDPVRRRIIDLLAEGEVTAGAIVEAVGAEFAISQPAVSRHLAILRSSGFAAVRPEGTRRLYSLDPSGLSEVDAWVERFRHLWAPRFDALAVEIARGKRQRRVAEAPETQTTNPRSDR
ncbi:metalloregulator ArsR/SmtB family transcription factor, partial [Nocardioides sp.]|uniref:ArsR/SmtB family transcription factor n=1 Tax=Nocardioides sp. TaxID=35761 RepID=UPI002EDB37E3